MANITATTFTYLGGQFQIGDGHTTENFTTVNQVTEVGFTGNKTDTVDVTTADNTDGVKRFNPTLSNSGTCDVSILWNPSDATHQQLQAAANSTPKTAHNFKRINPGTFGTRSFTGIIESLDLGKQSLDKPVTATMKIQISGPYVDA
jgi:hypothetical protein